MDKIQQPIPQKDVAAEALTHPIAQAINTFVAHVRDIEDCGSHFVPAAVEQKNAEVERLLPEIVALAADSKSHPDMLAQGLALRKLLDIARRIHRVVTGDRARTLRNSLFLEIFSAFDTFTGDLLAALFSIKSELFKALGGDVPLGEVLSAQTLDELKRSILYDRIEEFRRKSYVEQFDYLERLFDIRLKLFESWPEFVEMTQRRNLFAHCGGVVSSQYIEMCKREQYVSNAGVGQKLEINSEYLTRSCLVAAEVGLKLGHTLWRKVLPCDLGVADKHLHGLAYEALQFEEFRWAAIIGEFAVGQKKSSSEQNRLVALVNYAIALKSGGDDAAAGHLLNTVDWSAAAGEFKLADAVLRGDYDEAARFMEQIGESGELLNDWAYHDWPLFRDFRGTPSFLSAYEKVYRRSFKVDVSKVVSEAATSLEPSTVDADTSITGSGDSAILARSDGEKETPV